MIAGFIWSGDGGGQHHQASTHLTAAAFRAAADPAQYPEQIREGLRPWQAAKFYYTAGFGRGGLGTLSAVRPDSSTYDPVLGQTYDDIGTAARTMHRCQDVSQLLALPGGGRGGRPYHLQDCVIPGQMDKAETSMLDGLDLSLTGLTRFVSGQPPAALTASLTSIARSVDTAEAAFRARGAGAAVAGLAAGLHEVRALRQRLSSLGLGDGPAYEIDFRLAQKERQFQDALLAAASVQIDAVANDMVVTPGQPVTVSLLVANHGSAPVQLTDLSAGGKSTGPCPLSGLAAGAAERCTETLTIPADAPWTDIPFSHDPRFERYVFKPGVPFGAPFAPSPYRATFGFTIGGETVGATRDVEARNGTDMMAGEKRSELLVVPRLALTVSPDVLVIPTGSSSRREVRVTVRNDGTAAASGGVRLRVPAGWQVTPATVPISLTREDQTTTVRFAVTTPAGTHPGTATVSAEATSDGQTYAAGFQTVEYPHIRRRLLFHPAASRATLVDVKVAPNLAVGYVMGSGDRIPEAIEQLGVPVTLLGSDDLAWGDLSKYPVIMTGVRAYESRPDLRENNDRLLEYVRGGGVLLVNYNRTAFNDAQYGPYPAKTTSDRITDETAPVRVLAPDNPVFTTPNRLGPDTWANWVQERGTYFLGQYGPPYTDLIEMTNPFPNNPGPKRGALVEAPVGRGRWVYIGLVLWRQLPAGVPGAYQLLANLLSLGAPSGGAAAR